MTKNAYISIQEAATNFAKEATTDLAERIERGDKSAHEAYLLIMETPRQRKLRADLAGLNFEQASAYLVEVLKGFQERDLKNMQVSAPLRRVFIRGTKQTYDFQFSRFQELMRFVARSQDAFVSLGLALSTSLEIIKPVVELEEGEQPVEFDDHVVLEVLKAFVDHACGF